MPDLREEFEAAIFAEVNEQRAAEGDFALQHGEGLFARDDDGSYAIRWVKSAWWAWQASRAALLKDHVPMPRQCPSWLEDAYDDAFQEDKRFIDGLSLPAYEAMLKAQEEALQQAGIEVK